MSQNQLVTIQDNLQSLLNNKAKALPQNFNQTRFIQNCMVVLQDTKEIEKYDPISVARTMLKGAFLDLDFFNGECYPIPYGKELKFQTDYKGEVKVLKKYAIQQIKDIYAKVVRKGDEFQEKIQDGIQTITFIPKSFNNADIIGVFAVCFYADGSMVYETMSVEEVEKIRQNYSKQPNGQAWGKSFGEMSKKTVLRRLKKWIPIQFENTEQIEAFNDGGDAEFIEVKQNAKPDVDMPEAKKETKAEGKGEPDMMDVVMGLEEMKETKIIKEGLLSQIDKFLDTEKRDVKVGDALLFTCKKLPNKE
jgi:recombination protein RecT